MIRNSKCEALLEKRIARLENMIKNEAQVGGGNKELEQMHTEVWLSLRDAKDTIWKMISYCRDNNGTVPEKYKRIVNELTGICNDWNGPNVF